MRSVKTKRATNIIKGGGVIKEVDDFDYLGSLIAKIGDGIKEIRRRLGMATKKMKDMKKVWKGNNEKTKLKFLRSLIFPIATYGSETWSIRDHKISCYK